MSNNDVYFTSNPAEWRKLEGLYISERNPPGAVQGRDLSIVGMAGRCVRGPLTPQVITSVERFLEVYGGRDIVEDGALVGEVWKALLNKPFGQVVVRRVAAAAAVAATVTLDDTAGAGGTNILTITASSVGTWGNGITVSVEAATGGVATMFNLRVAWRGKEYLYEDLNLNSTADNSLEILGDDVGNLITITKLAGGRPHNQTATALTTGTDGTLAVSDYNSGFGDINTYDGVSIVIVPDSLEDTVAAAAQATFHATVVTAAASATDRMYLIWSGKTTNTPAQEITALGAQITTKSDRIVWCYNAGQTVDPETATKVYNGPHVWMASILSQNDVDIHPGAAQCSDQLAGVALLQNETLVRGDLTTMRAAGIAALEKISGRFSFRSAVTTSLESGKTEITRRRMADYLQLSAAERLRFYVKERNTFETRAAMAGELTAFSVRLRDDEKRIIEEFAIEQSSVNTVATRAQGIERILWRVKLVGHILHLVLETEIGTGVIIESN